MPYRFSASRQALRIHRGEKFTVTVTPPIRVSTFTWLQLFADKKHLYWMCKKCGVYARKKKDVRHRYIIHGFSRD